GFDYPLLEASGPERECSLIELATHLLGLARLEMHFDEPLQLSKRPRPGCLDVSDVDLDDFGARSPASIGHRCRHRHSKIAACYRACDRNVHVLDPGAGVGKSKPEREA